MQSVGNGIKSAGRKLTKTYTSFKSYVAERTAEIKETVVRELCTTANRITDALGKVDWKQVGITAALAVSAGVVALTGGAALAALPAMGGLGTAIAGGAITGAIGGAAFSGTSSLLSGESAGEVVEDTLLGGLTGGLTGGVLGGLGYGAGKLVDAGKNLLGKGSAATTNTQAVDVNLKYKEGWTAEQKAQADLKVKQLTEATTKKTPVDRSGTSARKLYKKAYGKDSIPAGYDVDHIVDLQLGGTNTVDNLQVLDKSVNRSLGKQINNAIKNYEVGTAFGQFNIS